MLDNVAWVRGELSKEGFCQGWVDLWRVCFWHTVKGCGSWDEVPCTQAAVCVVHGRAQEEVRIGDTVPAFAISVDQCGRAVAVVGRMAQGKRRAGPGGRLCQRLGVGAASGHRSLGGRRE